jgi:hypothetical protein
MTADSYTTQGAKISGASFQMLEPKDHYGRRRVHFFDYTVPTGDEADGNHVFACKLPPNARILGGEVVCDGCGTGAEVDVGLAAFDGSGYIDSAGTVADDDDFLGAALDIAAAGRDTFAKTIAQNYGYVTEKELWLVLTVENAGWDADSVIKGSIEIVVD